MVSRQAFVSLLAILATACGDAGAGAGQAPTSAPAPTAVDEQTQLTQQQADALAEAGFHTEGLLQGLPDTCRLAEGAGGPDQQAVDRIAVEFGDVGARGPMIAVDASTDITLLASTLMGADGSVGDAAVWAVHHDGAQIAAANALAAELTDFHLDPVTTRKENAVSSAMAEAMDCSWVVADVTHADPPEPEPEMRPDLLVLDPSRARPGKLVAMRFPEETTRGVAFQLDRRVGDAWEPVAWMTSDGNGREPVTVAAHTQGHGFPDVGVSGPGPDHVRLPESAAPGDYRVCTANAGEEFCAPLRVATG